MQLSEISDCDKVGGEMIAPTLLLLRSLIHDSNVYSFVEVNEMRYYESAYPVYASTDGVAYEVYLSGCNGYCQGCHSPHTHDFNAGLDLNDTLVFGRLVNDIKCKYDRGELDNIVIIGGEPLDQPEHELLDFLDVLSTSFPDCKLYLYTHFSEDEVRTRFSSILDDVDYIKCGKYDASKPNDQNQRDSLTGVTLATTNQYFIKGDRR